MTGCYTGFVLAVGAFMSITEDVVALTQALVVRDSRNPPGHEAECADVLQHCLGEAGLRVWTHEFAPGRTSLVARTAGAGQRAPLCLTGHLDVVPLGEADWSVNPLGGELHGGCLYGRGSADMKGGVAAMVVAAARVARETHQQVPLELVLTASEETDCEGAQHLAALPEALSRPGAMVIGEPTDNAPLVAHKGALWLTAHARGVTAHGSTPAAGDNAIFKMARAVRALEAFEFDVPAHPLLGRPTLNPGLLGGGQNLNSVPDHAWLGIDIRTLPGQDHQKLLRQLQQSVGEEIRFEVLQNTTGIATDPAHDWVQQLCAIVAEVSGVHARAGAAGYYTDGSVLKPALGDPPTVILGPGSLAQAHATDEYCHIDQLEQATEIYAELARRY